MRGFSILDIKLLCKLLSDKFSSKSLKYSSPRLLVKVKLHACSNLDKIVDVDSKDDSGKSKNIEAYNDLIEKKNEDVIADIKNFKHVIIDEAQDITGIRSTLLQNIIKSNSQWF